MDKSTNISTLWQSVKLPHCKCGSLIGKILIYLILVLLSAAFLVPFFWLISSSLKTNTELYANPPIIWPAEPQWSNYRTAVQSFPFLQYLGNTLIILGCNLLGTLLSSSLVAYGFSRIDWKGRDSVFILVLMSMMLPFQATMIPFFIEFQKLGWLGTRLPLIVPAFFGNAFNIFLLRQFFVGVPKEISSAAKVDGANEFRIYSKIILPLAKPALASVGIFTFMRCWNDFVGPLVFLSDNKLYTLSIGVQQIMGEFDPRWTLMMAIGMLMVLPVLILFFVMQKYFIQGITFSAVKG